MRVLCIGDVVGAAGLNYLCDNLPAAKRQHKIDLCVVNGENADKSGTGLTRHSAQQILSAGADAVTTGNHCFRRTDTELYTESYNILCPANHPAVPCEAGVARLDFGRYSAEVYNLSGVAFMDSLNNPFDTLDGLLKSSAAKIKIVDFHAESTAEKKAFAYYFAGRVSAVFGTHTHVATRDICILPGKTGYITDVGMTGPVNSVIGVNPAEAIEKQRRHTPVKFDVADGECKMQGAIFEISTETGECTAADYFEI